MCNSAYAPADNELSTQFTLNLKDADIRSLIESVSFQTGKNFIVDPRVSGNVTVISSTPVDNQKLYDLFLGVLQVHGLAAIAAGDVVKIIPDFSAIHTALPILGNSNNLTDQLVSQVISVVNIRATELVSVLRPLIPQEGHLAAYADSNSLIITDRAANINRLREIVQSIDQPNSAEVELVALQHASASYIVNVLKPIPSSTSSPADYLTAVKLIPDDRSNSILIHGGAAARARTRSLIVTLDSPLESGGNTEVIFLKYADAEDIAKILRSINQSSSVQGENIADQRIESDYQSDESLAETDADFGEDSGSDDQYESFSDVRLAGNTAGVQIEVDSNTNAVIVTAPPDQMKSSLDIIRQLDVRRAQILVEAVIAEITEDNVEELGVNFLLNATEKSGTAGYSNLGGVTQNILGVANAASAGSIPDALGSGVSLALGKFATGGFDFGLLLRAIASNSENNILSTPTIMALNNEEAEIIVGTNVPFVTGQQLSSNNDNPFQTIERQDIGLRLKVLPQINEGDTIKLTLEQDVSSVNATALTGAADITTSKRSLKTTVLVEDGQTLVLGGLIDEQVSDTQEKIPLLGDIPGLGRLFRYSSTRTSKKNLVIFLRPVILRHNKTTEQLSNSRRDLLRRSRSMEQSIHPTDKLNTKSKHGRIQPSTVNENLIDTITAEARWKELPDGSMLLVK